MKKVHILVIALCIASLFAMGCEKKGYLQNLGKTRLGVVLESDKPVDSMLSGYIAEQIRQHTKLTVIDFQALPLLAEYARPDTLTKLQSEQKINYVLVCRLSDKGAGNYSGGVAKGAGGITATGEYKRTLLVNYKVLSVPSGEIVYTGQSTGEAVRKGSVTVGGQGATSASVNMDDERRIFEEAILKALNSSGLYY